MLEDFSYVEVQIELKDMRPDLIGQAWARVGIFHGQVIPMANMQAVGPDMNDGVSQTKVGSDLCELFVGHVEASSDEEDHYQP